MAERSGLVLGGVLAGALMVAASGQAQAVPNLVVNGNFATGNFAGWTYTSGGGSAAVVVNPDGDTLVIGSPDLSVGSGVYFSTDATTQTLSQSLTLGVGYYSIGFDLAAVALGNPQDATFTASIAGTPLLSSASVHAIGAAYGQGNWVNVTGLADVAIAGTYTVSFSFTGLGGTASDVVIDRVFVAQGDVLPEPASMALLAAPVFGLVALRRRRKAALVG